ncbi:MAG: hypothetical protein ABS62_02450 [Microbacterium sp. SCN 70-200]|uniref:DUF3180 domain-containing protein n=1 Tax=unclassified Microbacterium TaxID=2609290 RepID=UPI00086E98F5|nr:MULTISPECIES: DUF3180 domain-containing protein [unclassified Microbacterium]MBN9215353.1 DUF3180 domain-containing protein [Microbacterium sp.]ODT42747.1 MAG: hypothetical protein ABS62_02450 [Microbacterium sp. SCN 70-200]OJV79779.1 MAG: hypothetical protein BGO46_09945 [Microbacterium sp. 70-16]
MKRTSASVLVIAGILGLIVGFGVDQLLTSAGQATFTPSLLLPVLLVLLAAADILFALPIRRAITGRDPQPVDPFRAVRVAMLAKASSIVGAIVAGIAAGLVVFLLTRPVAPVGSVLAAIASLVGGIVLLAAALVAEHLCTIRKDDDDEQPGPDEPGFGFSHHD